MSVIEWENVSVSVSVPHPITGSNSTQLSIPPPLYMCTPQTLMKSDAATTRAIQTLLAKQDAADYQARLYGGSKRGGRGGGGLGGGNGSTTSSMSGDGGDGGGRGGGRRGGGGGIRSDALAPRGPGMTSAKMQEHQKRLDEIISTKGAEFGEPGMDNPMFDGEDGNQARFTRMLSPFNGGGGAKDGGAGGFDDDSDDDGASSSRLSTDRDSLRGEGGGGGGGGEHGRGGGGRGVSRKHDSPAEYKKIRRPARRPGEPLLKIDVGEALARSRRLSIVSP